MTQVKKSNLDFWDKVQTSDPSTVKEIKLGRKFNAVNAHAQIKKATEMWGQFGREWGVRGEVFTVLTGSLLLYQAEFFYPNASFSISSSISMTYSSGKLDDECVKKVATDALTKGLSKVGFNADIFLGMWDDNRYVAGVKERVELDVRANLIMKLHNTDSMQEVADIWTQNSKFQADAEFKQACSDAKKRLTPQKPVKDEPKTDGDA